MSVTTFSDGELHLGDCLKVLDAMPSRSADLIYMDPPFFTQQVWTGKAGSFDDRWPDLDSYIEHMRQRVARCHRVLKFDGLFYLHCTPPISNNLAIMCDRLFGPTKLLNKIVWKRTQGSHSKQGKTLAHVYDTILCYYRRDDWQWNDAEHDDVWLDVGLGSHATERVGYPTQKPVALLERIIAASGKPGDVVLDPFCGSGTTLKAARNLGRRFIGIDQSVDAISVANDRLTEPQQLGWDSLGKGYELPEAVNG